MFSHLNLPLLFVVQQQPFHFLSRLWTQLSLAEFSVQATSISYPSVPVYDKDFSISFAFDVLVSSGFALGKFSGLLLHPIETIMSGFSFPWFRHSEIFQWFFVSPEPLVAFGALFFDTEKDSAYS